MRTPIRNQHVPKTLTTETSNDNATPYKRRNGKEARFGYQPWQERKEAVNCHKLHVLITCHGGDRMSCPRAPECGYADGGRQRRRRAAC